jgi:G3E family GTPase
MQNSKLPVTILTGCLGAGKTTFLNELLRNSAGKKIAVIENEFGDIGLDGKFIAKTIDPAVIELSAGCICCDLSTELTGALRELLSAETKYSCLIIETTGIADPSQVAKPFLSDPVISQGFELDAVVCVADAKNICAQLAEHKEAQMQLAYADIVAISKTDACSPSEKNAAYEAIAAASPCALITECSYGVPEIEILGTGAYSARNPFRINLNLAAVPGLKSHGYVSESFIIGGRADIIHFRLWVNTFCFFNHRSVVRIKGLFAATDGNTYSIHAVRDSVAVQVSGSDLPKGQNTLVFIGKSIDAEQIRLSLAELFS